MSGNLPETPYELGETSSQGTYVSIPIPQRQQEVRKKTRRTLASYLSHLRFPKWILQPLTTIQRQRRKEFLQSIFAAIVINLLIALTLLTIAIAPPAFSAGDLFTATVATDEKAEDESESADGGSESAQAESEKSGSADITSLNAASITSMAISPMTLQMDSQDMNAPTLTFGQSVMKSDFDAIDDAERKKMKAFVNSKGGSLTQGNGLRSGVSENTLKGLFPQSKFGNGAGMAVIVDMSGSMQKINQVVDAYIEDNFPKGITRHVNGCALKGNSDPFLKALASETRKESRTDYFFICDLQDGETGEGIGRIRNCLVLGKFPKRLHVVSFGKRPGRHLAKMLETTKGTFVYIDPTLNEDEEKK